MLTSEQIIKAQNNVANYMREGLLSRGNFNLKIIDVLKKNSSESVKLAEIIFTNKYSNLWVIVICYYSMFYSANAVLCQLGYKVGDKIAHKITSDALIVFVREKLKESLLEDYEAIREDALATMKAENIVQSFDLERLKRGKIQYSTSDEVLTSKAKTSLERAKEFNFALMKMLV